MYVLITYDVQTMDSDGRRRLRRIAKVCLNYGQRVQNSVFECKVSEQEYLLLKSQIIKEMDSKKDSVRFYHLGTKYKSKIEHFGIKEPYDVEEAFII